MADYDLAVIGGGSGGVRAARLAATQGMRVVLFERDALGGTCVNRGCVPKKLMVLAAAFSGQCDAAAAMGWDVPAASDFRWPDFIQAKDAYLSRLNGIYRERLLQAGVDIIASHASIQSANTITADGNTYNATNILLATGGKPALPDIDGISLAVSSDDMFHLQQRPQRALVVGGGYIALEFACILHGLGCEVRLVHRNETLLRGFDRELVAFLINLLRQRGITIDTGYNVKSVSKDGDSRRVLFTDNTAETTDLVLFATGRAAAVARLGLDNVGLGLDKSGRLAVDSDYRSAVPSIYALGDLVGHKALTPVAITEAGRFVEILCGDEVAPIDYDMVASAVFTEPSMATVGLSEEAARDRGIAVRIYRSTVTPLHAALHSQPHKHKSMVKVVCDSNDTVLGMHIVGHEAGEIIQGYAVAVRMGMNISDLRQTIAVHPTMSEEFVTL